MTEMTRPLRKRKKLRLPSGELWIKTFWLRKSKAGQMNTKNSSSFNGNLSEKKSWNWLVETGLLKTTQSQQTSAIDESNQYPIGPSSILIWLIIGHIRITQKITFLLLHWIMNHIAQIGNFGMREEIKSSFFYLPNDSWFFHQIIFYIIIGYRNK